MYFTVPSILSAPVLLMVLSNIGSGFVTAASIYELANATPSLSTLKTAIDEAGLTAALSGSGTLTVFAPTNEAFGKLDAATLAKYLQPEWSHHLKDILLYHVLSTRITSAELVDGSFETLNGESIVINATALTINDSSAIVTDVGSFDISADNGVVRKYSSFTVSTMNTLRH